MSDEILVRDRQVGIEMGWHRKTIIVDEITPENAFNFEYIRTPIYANKGGLKKVPGWDIFISSDDNQICGKPVADTYQEISNKRFYEIFQNAMGGTGAKVESIGTIRDRSQRFMTIKLPDDCVTIGKRVFKQRINILDSINGTVALHAINSSICVVCANTFNMTLGDFCGEFRFKLKHTATISQKIVNMEEAINALCGVNAQFNQAMKEASEMPIAKDDFEPLVTGFLLRSEKAQGKALTTRTKNAANRIATLGIVAGKGNDGETLLDVFSGATDYYSHESAGGTDEEKQDLSAFNGSGNRLSNEFFGQLFNLDDKGRFVGIASDRIETMVKTGRKALQEYAMAN